MQECVQNIFLGFRFWGLGFRDRHRGTSAGCNVHGSEEVSSWRKGLGTGTAVPRLGAMCTVARRCPAGGRV